MITLPHSKRDNLRVARIPDFPAFGNLGDMFRYVQKPPWNGCETAKNGLQSSEFADWRPFQGDVCRNAHDVGALAQSVECVLYKYEVQGSKP